MKNFLLILFYLFFINPINGQHASEMSKIDFAISILQTPKLNIERNYALTENAIFNSKSSLAFQASLSIHKSISNQLNYELGVFGGLNSMSFQLSIADEFNRLGWDGYSGKYKDYEFPYFGIIAGINYTIFENEKGTLTIGGAINPTYFFKQDYTFGVSAIPDNGQRKSLFTSTMDINSNNAIKFIPQINLAYYHAFHPKFSWYAKSLFSYSNTEMFDAEYIIFGDNKNLTGQISKPFKYFGIQFGVLYRG